MRPSMKPMKKARAGWKIVANKGEFQRNNSRPAHCCCQQPASQGSPQGEWEAEGGVVRC